MQPVAIARANVIALVLLVHEFHADGAPAAVGIRLGVVTQRIKMRQIIADRCEGILLVLPVSREIDFAAGGSGHALKYGVGNRLEVGFLRAHHVDGGAGGLRKLGDVLGRNHAVVIGTVGEDHDHFSPGKVRGVLHGEQQTVVKLGIVSGYGGTRSAQNLRAVGGENGSTGKVATVGIEGHFVRASRERTKSAMASCANTKPRYI